MSDPVSQRNPQPSPSPTPPTPLAPPRLASGDGAGLDAGLAIRAWLKAQWQTPRGRIRVLGWSVLLAAGVLALLAPFRGWARALWTGVNILLALRGLGWTLWHPFGPWRVRGVILRWSFWPALVVTLMLRSNLEPLLAEVTGQWLPSSLVYAFSLVLFLPLLLVATLIWSVLGAGMGAFEARRKENAVARTGLVLRAWWLVTLLAVLVAALLEGIDPAGPWPALGIASVPLGTLGLYRFVRRWDETTLADRFEDWLTRSFVWRRAGGRSLDFRGAVLALGAFLITWALAQLKLLMPLQASALLQAILLFGAAFPGRLEIEQMEPVRGTNGMMSTSLPGFLVRMEPARASRQIVLMEWDPASLREATTIRSETAIQAALIRELIPLGTRRICLPPPMLESAVFSGPLTRAQPIPDADDFLRARKDLPLLESAVRDAGNVLLLAPGRNVLDFELFSPTFTKPDLPESFRVLSPVALETGTARMLPLQIAALPAVPLGQGDEGLPPAALQLAAAALKSTHTEPRFIGVNRVAVLGREYPVMDSQQGRLLLDFVTATRGGDFPRVSYSSVLRGERLFDPSAGEQGEWQSPAEFFRDKIVLLPPIRSLPVASPWGSMDPTEQLAYGVRTLLGSFFIHPVSDGVQTTWALLCALTVGGLVVRRDPIKSSGRLFMVAVAAFGLSLFLFLDGLWLDPVFPCVAATVAFLLVTQLTFRMEQSAKERNRFLLDRFVAPQVVDELLEPGMANFGVGGRRERVTVLFADVRGFTQFAERHSPEEVMKVVNAYLEVMTEALHRHGGILDKYTGDGLMALFREERGVTAVDAVRGALAMRDAALALSVDRTAGGDSSLQVGISLHVGEAVVGLVGNPERQVNFTALGHTVVVAARLQTQAGGGEVVVSREVQESVGDVFDLSPRTPVIVKGISQPVVPFLVHRVRQGVA